MGVVEAIPVLTPDEARRAVDDVHAERAQWTTRFPATEFEFSTLGAASYLDANHGQFDAYQALAQRFNPVLRARFDWLLERLRHTVAAAVGASVRYDDRLALPGFHIFQHLPGHPTNRASLHYDLQYELIDWTAIGAPETSSQLSLTLALALPEAGGGLLVWNINRTEIMRLPEDERRAHMQANRFATHHRYAIGSLALHSGHQLHQIAPTPAQPGDQRITLQAHALRVDGEWLLYW